MRDADDAARQRRAARELCDYRNISLDRHRHGYDGQMDQEPPSSSSPDTELARRSGDRRRSSSHNPTQPAVERRRGDRRSKPGLKVLVEDLLGRG